MKPQAGIFVDQFSEDDSGGSSRVDVRYTVVADELALYNMSMNKTQFRVNKVEVDVQRRWVCFD